jgi:hypothetical protein
MGPILSLAGGTMGTRTFEYGPYELVCTATPADGGGFAVRLVVALGHDSAREETPVDLEISRFKTEDEAFSHAEASGRDWVDNFG